MWFRKRPITRFQDPQGVLLLELGQIVRHKIAGGPAVVVRLFFDENDAPAATVAMGDCGCEEFNVSIYEIEPAMSVGAVDRVGERVTE